MNDSFGASQDVAIVMAKGLKQDWKRSRVAMVKPEAAERRLQEGREFIGKFAHSHPMETLYFQRDSIGGRSDSIALPEGSGFGAGQLYKETSWKIQ